MEWSDEGIVLGVRLEIFRDGDLPRRLELSERLSSKGNSICITLTLTAHHVDEVVLAYERLHDVPSLRLIL